MRRAENRREKSGWKRRLVAHGADQHSVARLAGGQDVRIPQTELADRGHTQAGWIGALHRSLYEAEKRPLKAGDRPRYAATSAVAALRMRRLLPESAWRKMLSRSFGPGA